MKDKLSGCLPVVYATLIFFLLVLFVAAFGSCYTQKKAQQQTQKALAVYPSIVADIARTAFPCVTTKADTIITTQDSLIYIDCPDIGNGSAEDFIKDTIVLTKIVNSTKTIKVPVLLPVKTVTVIKKVEDSAKIFLLNKQLEAEKKVSANNQAKADMLQRKSERKSKWLWGLLLLLIGSVYLNYRQLIKK